MYSLFPWHLPACSVWIHVPIAEHRVMYGCIVHLVLLNDVLRLKERDVHKSYSEIADVGCLCSSGGYWCRFVRAL